MPRPTIKNMKTLPEDPLTAGRWSLPNHRRRTRLGPESQSIGGKEETMRLKFNCIVMAGDKILLRQTDTVFASTPGGRAI
jgi:hypothetical protein